MANLPRWLVRVLYTSRPSVYIVVLGIVSLITIPTLQQIPDQLGLLAWWMRVVGYLLSLSVAATLVHQLTQLVIPPRPTKPPPEKVETAEIPISAQRDTEEVEESESEDNTDNEPNLEPPKGLSRFARKRIGRQHPGLQHSKPVFERRKSIIVLFLQLDKRQVLRTTRVSRDGKTKKLLFPRREPSTTIYGRALAFIAATYLFFVVLASLRTSGSTLTPGAYVVLFVLLAMATIAGVRLFYKVIRWYDWRFIQLEANPELGFEEKVVIVNKPRFFLGGAVETLNISEITNATSATAESKDDFGSFRSNIAGVIRREWVKLDTPGQKDELFHYNGPFRDAPQLVSSIDRAMTATRRRND